MLEGNHSRRSVPALPSGGTAPSPYHSSVTVASKQGAARTQHPAMKCVRSYQI